MDGYNKAMLATAAASWDMCQWHLDRQARVQES